jgi:hypothetical protein
MEGRDGLFVVCGEASGNLECLEFEGRAVVAGIYTRFGAAVCAAGLQDVWDRICAGYMERSPSDGLHLPYRCSEIAGNTKLAQRRSDDGVEVLVETRGRGGGFIAAPSRGRVHPTGKPWVRELGGFDTIATVTPEERAELLRVAATFDEMPPPPPRREPRSTAVNGDRPGDLFNERASWDDVLVGWSFVFERGGTAYWRRPGKERGISATTNHAGTDTLKVFSTSTVLPTDGTLDKFAAFAYLNHSGDFGAAARAVADDEPSTTGTRGTGYREPESEGADGDTAADNSDGDAESDDHDSEPRRRPSWPELGAEAYHGLAGEVVRALLPHTEADPAAMLLDFVTEFGCAIGNGAKGVGPHVLVGRTVHDARLFVVLVGDTSRARKGTAHSVVHPVFVDADPSFAERKMSGFGSGEVVVDAVRDPDPDDPEDCGVLDKRLLVYEGEFSGVLKVAGREGNKLSPIVRNAWDRERLEARSRKFTAIATGAHISAVAHVVRDELLHFLRSEDIAGGFANRHLFPVVRRSKKLPGGGTLDRVTVTRLSEKTRTALERAKKLGQLKRTPEAEALWALMYDYLTEDVYGLYGKVVARAEAQCLRLSVAYAAVDGAPQIGVNHLAAAWELYRYCDWSARLIFGPDLTGDEVADRLLEALRDAHPNGLNATQQRDVFSRHVTAERLRSARSRLEELGLSTTKNEQSGGRPRVVTYPCAQSSASNKTPDLPPASALLALIAQRNEHPGAAGGAL